MNVSCPECRSVFRLDPAKITSISMRARCSVCGGLIPVGAAVSWGDDLPAVAPAGSGAASGTPRGVKPILSRTPAPAAATPSQAAWPPPVPRAEPRAATPSPRPPAPQAAAPQQRSETPVPAAPAPRPRTPPFSPRISPAIPKEPVRAEEAAPAPRAETPKETTSPSTFSMSFGAPLTPPSRTAIPEPPPTGREATTQAFTPSGNVSAAFSTPSTPAPPPAVVQRKPINPESAPPGAGAGVGHGCVSPGETRRRHPGWNAQATLPRRNQEELRGVRRAGRP
jgi:predicted Zn finger-like uncharacterized protein